MTGTTHVPLTIYSLKKHIGTGNVVCFNAGPSGEVCFVIALAPLDYQTEGNGFAIFPKITPGSPQRYRLLIMRSGELELDLIIDHEPLNIHDIQPLGDSLLLTNSRSEYRGSGDFDRNGRVYSREGIFLQDFLLGDGIEAIQTTGHGEIWTSYFDEGIFGNFGWHDPVGTSGLVAWTSTGEKIYEYEATGSVEMMSDCYALNVETDDDIWCCYYPDFPLVHLHNKQIVSTWKIPIKGSRAFAIENSHALFSGGYEDRDMFQLIRLDASGKTTQITQFKLRDDQGEIMKVERVIGRGGTLYILSQDQLLEISLGDLLAQHGC